MTKIMNYKGILIPSQDPHVATRAHREIAEHDWLPELVKMMLLVEAETGYRWHATSYWRKSPSHHKGCSLDIAPDIANSSKKYYAVYNNSDPVLYKRTRLIRDLQRAVKHWHSTEYSLGVYIESDHLHMQVFPHTDAKGRARLFKWGLPKHNYPDTMMRSRMPMIDTLPLNK